MERTEVTVTRVTHVTYFISSSKIQEFWKNEIADMTTSSIKMADGVIDEKVLSAIRISRNQLSQYSDNYVNIIKTSIADARKGEAHRQNLLRSAERRSVVLDGILSKLQTCREMLDGKAESI